ncbi:MAG: hypothetical protein NTW19_09615 [Planctomycetota bacterium]|nr:hypothetical protein [Planctomycetota bacterium]
MTIRLLARAAARPMRILLAALALAAIPFPAHATETENHGLRVLPAPSKMTIDADDSDWDLSGSVFACGDAETQRDRFAVWFSAMYDETNLYFLLRWTDDTPMSNPGSTAGNFGWDGDCVQIRVVANYNSPAEQLNVFNCWRGADGKDVVERDTKGKTKNTPKGDDVKPQGAQQAFKENPDHKGYVQEIAIPWALITSDGKPRHAGEELSLTIEPNFTAGPTNGRMSIKDIFRPGVTIDRVFTFGNKTIWGVATLEAKGAVAPRPVRLADGREFKTTLVKRVPTVDWTGIDGETATVAVKSIPFKMPEAGYVSMQVLNGKGEIVRHLLTAERREKGPQEAAWDGLTTPMFRTPGTPVDAGKYTWRAIWHKGIGMRLRGWASNSGTAPWDGTNPSDNWGGDMGGPAAAACDGERMYLGWSVSEAGKALVVTDFDGKPLWHHKRGGFGGAGFVAVDGGAAYVYDGQDKSLYSVSTATGIYTPWPGGTSADVRVDSLWPAGGTVPENLTGLDAKNGKLYLAGAKGPAGLVVVLDTKTGKLIRTIEVPAPGAMRAVSDELLYVVSGGVGVLAVNPQTGATKPVVAGLVNATGLAVGAEGELFVGVNEPDFQVKVFSAEGKPLRVIGAKGGRPVLGPWQSGGMRAIAGIAVDPRGQLWVTEGTLYPRRISVWNAKTGSLVRELFGPTHYGASGGAIHPNDPDVMVGEGCEWKLDPKTGMASCAGVFDANGGGFLGGNSFARFCTGKNGKDYLAVANLSAGNIVVYQRLAPGKYARRSSITSDPKAKTTTFWADANGDEQVQENETATLAKALTLGGYYFWSMNLNTDMTLYGGEGRIRVADFTSCAAPRYDPAKFEAVAGLPYGLSSLDNELLLSCGVEQTSFFQCFDAASGKVLWQYPNLWAGVHGSHNAPAPALGLLRGAFGPIGCFKAKNAGYVWAINTNVGEWHLLTQDGYYLSCLFEADALKQEYPVAKPGAVMDRMPCGLGGEDFGGSVVQGDDGNVYVQAGKTADWNIQMTGLDTIHKLGSGSVEIDANDVRKATGVREAALQQAVGKQRMAVHKLTPTFTGDLAKDFAGAQVVSYKKQDDAAIKSAVAWDDKNFYVAWDVADKTPWANGATEPAMLYLGGDTVDLQLGTDPAAAPKRGEPVAGDLRVSIGNFQGTPTAVLFRKVVAGSGAKQPKSFSSGVVKDYKMDFAAPIAGAVVKVTPRPGAGYLVEASLPLADLGLAAKPGLTIHGDLGATHGDAAGQRTRLRTYWSNQHTGIVDDAVFELMMEPANWGEWKLE